MMLISCTAMWFATHEILPFEKRTTVKAYNWKMRWNYSDLASRKTARIV